MRFFFFGGIWPEVGGKPLHNLFLFLYILGETIELSLSHLIKLNTHHNPNYRPRSHTRNEHSGTCMCGKYSEGVARSSVRVKISRHSGEEPGDWGCPIGFRINITRDMGGQLDGVSMAYNGISQFKEISFIYSLKINNTKKVRWKPHWNSL